MAKTAKTRKRNAGEGYGFTFHGAFKNKADAAKKEAATAHAFVRPVMYRDGFRYVVMVPRTENPKRRANVSKKKSTRKTTPPRNGGRTRNAVRRPSRRNGLGSWLGKKLGYAGSETEYLINRLRGKKKKKSKTAKGVPRAAKTASRQGIGGAPASSSVIADVASALRNQGFNATDAKKMAQSAYNKTRSDDVVTVFRAAMARQNPKQQRPAARRKPIVKRRSVPKVRRSKRNPNAQQWAAAKFEQFHGRPSEEVIKVLEAEGISKEEAEKIASLIPPEDYTGMGDLIELRCLAFGDDAKNAARIIFDPDQEKKRVRLCCNPEGDQMYFVGGDQDVGELAKAGMDIGFAMVDLGECIFVEYRTRKAMDQFQTVNYYHELGEETGERPHLLYSTAYKRLYLVGGDYEVKPEGIVN
jgi:hypothetical protein